jgi:hypothetical protein
MSTTDVDASGFGQRLAPPGDAWEGATFDALYEKQIKPELARCEVERQRDVTVFVAVLAAGAVALGAEIVFLPVPFFWVVTGIAAVVGGYWPLARLKARAKTAVLTALCAPMGLSYQPKISAPDALGRFFDLRLLPRPESAVYVDSLEGRRGKTDVALCAAALTQGSGKNRHLVFKGQLFRLTGGRRRASTTVVLRNSGWLNGFKRPQGLDQVGLEDPHFNKEFVVFGSDQVEAREILTPSFMQRLLELEQLFSGSHIRCAFTELDLLIALETSLMLDIGGMFSSLVDRARASVIAGRLEAFFKVVDGFSQT